MEQSTAALEARIGQLKRELGETRAKEGTARLENLQLRAELQTRTEERDEARRQQTATADVLKVISRSQVDLQAVFETLVDLAARLCRAERATILRLNGDCFTLAASYGMPAGFREYLRANPFRLDRGSLSGRAALECRPVHVPDVLADPDFTQHETQKLGGFRSALAAPLMREGSAIGSIFLTRAAVDPFTQQEIELITTFADQAVIAIENTRLFEEVQARTRELQESLEYQTATSDVLGVISRSPTNVQPVFDTIVESASRLCSASYSVVWRYDGDLLHYAASHNFTSEVLDHILRTYPKRPDRSVAAGRAILDGTVAHVPDMLADRDYAKELALAGNWRASIAVPMLQDGKSVGAISVAKAQAEPFSERQIQLLSTFADQAVIAIENVRLFEEVQARTRELQEALEHQTAMSNVLQAISSSPGALQPVYHSVLRNALQHCQANLGMLYHRKDDLFYCVAHLGLPQGSPNSSTIIRSSLVGAMHCTTS